ncbi:V-type ATP synthase subunit I [Hespellia stercorisuis]|uniref:V/A-type H+-transporting ATPase subunit I n=1 Tax=Hespellia stercorisuis DSM 15480 TaxID=1121950 RepID=A0A1M6K5N1_9FIRM|nr:V-type ATPase 116kDa subunit family protein [Hespellia stercorisuis]SHJ54268.1 V/A-type H+-transporting ATPase subunit I [Hespellia stercorisuis DSM 15480]
MIVKMKFVSITGPRSDIDRVTDLYLSRYEIQLEHAMSELKTVDNLRPFVEVNPYKDALTKATQYVGLLKNQNVEPDTSMGLDDMFEVVRSANHDYLEFEANKDQLKRKREELREKQKMIAPFRPLNCDLHEVLRYKYIKYRFGRISTEYHHRMEKYLLEDLGAVFVEGERDESFVYGAYFVAQGEAHKVDAVFKSLHFERIELPDVYEGTPDAAYHELEKEIAGIGKQIEDVDAAAGDMLAGRAAKLVAAKKRLEDLASNFDVRKLAARVEDNQEDYYILCGWMAETDVEKFLHEIKDDDKIFVVVEDDHDNYFGEPPTKLNNPKVFKPFEMFIQMYGLPAHDEMDPTVFVALTYTFIFGVMFGDVGQGLCLLIGGAIIYKVKKAPLAGIISTAGIFSTIFGFMFGSFFGFEDVIEPIWIRPIEHMTKLPFIGKLNTVFVVAVAFGMGIILLSMVFHIINALRAHDKGDALFDVNGVAGLVFYGSAVATIVLFMTGNSTPAGIVLAVMFGLPLLLILFKEPLTKKLEKKAAKSEEGIGMFLVQGFFELFETLLSYFSNTLSFVRIGAFAVSHAAMMQVVLQLAGAESGSPNWIVVVLGNAFVCGMEGLIVGIQVLRLEYYEMFSRFYKGTGRKFQPYNEK